MDTPVVLIIFNRPQLTEKVFNVISMVRPSTLIVVADGVRTGVDDDKKNCESAREVVEQCDWGCNLIKLYSDFNLGCRDRVVSGLDWVFNHYEEAIIIEDDCLPDITFFRFCSELLEKYRYDTRIMAISGNNFQEGQRRTKYSYYFSIFPNSWGWATWQRAWQHYDRKMKLWSEGLKYGVIKNLFKDDHYARYWERTLESVFKMPNPNIWDYVWLFSFWMQSGLAIIPEVNLVSNIGFNKQATNTFSKCNKFQNRPARSMEFPLFHPSFVLKNSIADEYLQRRILNKQPSSLRLKSRINKLTNRMVDCFFDFYKRLSSF